MPTSNPQQEPDYEEELLEADIDETEELEGSEDEVSDQEGDYLEDDVDSEGDDEEQEPDEETGEEPDAIVIPWHDDNGDERELEIGLDEIPQLLEYAEYGKKMAEYNKQAEGYFKENQGLITIGKGVMDDSFLKEIVTWRAQGYSEADISKSLYLHYNGQMDNNLTQPSIDEEFPDVDDTAKQYLERQLSKRLTPLQEQLSRQQTERQAEQTIARNNEIIGHAFYEEGIGSLTAQEQSAFTKTFREIYPNIDTAKEMLTPRQIKVALREAGILAERQKSAAPKAKVATKPNTAAIAQAKKAAPIAPAKTGTQAMKKSVSTAGTREAKFARLANAGIF